jgi:hypothetical protein
VELDIVLFPRPPLDEEIRGPHLAFQGKAARERRVGDPCQRPRPLEQPALERLDLERLWIPCRRWRSSRWTAG